MRMVVTGAASGIGRAVAFLAAAEGADLFLVDRSSAVHEVAAGLRDAAPGRIASVVADLSEPDEIPGLVAAGAEHLGGLDALVSNAGINPPGSLLDTDVETFDRVFAVNTRPAWLLARAAHSLLAQSRGAIVATASISATQPTPGLGAYAASKAALLMLIRQLAVEWGPDGIRCNCVSPGPTMSGMTAPAFGGDTEEKRRNRARREAAVPIRRIGESEDVARAILFLASPESRQITGANLLVDGGLSQALMPATGGGSGYRAG